MTSLFRVNDVTRACRFVFETWRREKAPARVFDRLFFFFRVGGTIKRESNTAAPARQSARARERVRVRPHGLSRSLLDERVVSGERRLHAVWFSTVSSTCACVRHADASFTATATTTIILYHTFGTRHHVRRARGRTFTVVSFCTPPPIRTEIYWKPPKGLIKYYVHESWEFYRNNTRPDAFIAIWFDSIFFFYFQ